MGADDALCGIISSFISLAMLFQLCSLFVVGRITNTKKTAVAVHTAAQLLFTALYLIPFLPFPDAYKRPVFVICMLAAYFGNYLVTSVIFKWGMSFVDPARRARYASVKEMVSLASGVIVSLLIGFLCGGSGIALIANGLPGIVAGAVLSLLVLALGKDKMQEVILNSNIPSPARKLLPKSVFTSRMDKITKEVKDNLYKNLEGEKNEEISERLVKEISEQIESCLTRMAEVVEIPIG